MTDFEIREAAVTEAHDAYLALAPQSNDEITPARLREIADAWDEYQAALRAI